MATRVLNRRAMREQHDQAEKTDRKTVTTVESPTPEPKVKKTRARKTAPRPAGDKPPPKPRSRKKASKEPARRVARWAVFDNGMKRVAVFEYKDRTEADARLADMLERKSGAYFLQLVKDPYEPPAGTESVAAV